MVQPEPLSWSVTLTAYRSLDIPGHIDVTMADPPDLGLLWFTFVYTRTALFPLANQTLHQQACAQLECSRGRSIKGVHNRICSSYCFILECRVTLKGANELTKHGEVPKKAQCSHIWHDEISRSELEVLVVLLQTG